MLLSNRKGSSILYRGAGVALGIVLFVLAVCPALAQDLDQDIATANQFATALSELNAWAIEQSVRTNEFTSQAFITEMDALRALGHAAEFESGERVAVQDANEYVTYLEGLRTLDPMPLVASASQ